MPPSSLADDGVVGQQQGDQRHQEGGQAGQAGDRRRHRGEADLAGRGGAEPGDAHREQGEQQADRQQPAIAQAVGQFLAGDGPDYGHGVAPAGAGTCGGDRGPPATAAGSPGRTRARPAALPVRRRARHRPAVPRCAGRPVSARRQAGPVPAFEPLRVMWAGQAHAGRQSRLAAQFGEAAGHLQAAAGENRGAVDVRLDAGQHMGAEDDPGTPGRAGGRAIGKARRWPAGRGPPSVRRAAAGAVRRAAPGPGRGAGACPSSRFSGAAWRHGRGRPVPAGARLRPAPRP